MMAEKIKSFEGVDFNKEIGIPLKKDENIINVTSKEEKTEISSVINLSGPNENEDEEAEELFE